VMSPGRAWLLGWLFSSSVMVLLQRVYRISLADRTVGLSRALGAARSLAFLERGGCRSSNFQRERRPSSCKNRKEPVARHSGNRNKIQLFDCCRANHNRMPQALPSPESLPDPSRWALVPLCVGGYAASVFACAIYGPALGSVQHSRHFYCVPFDSIDDDKCFAKAALPSG
jgi:hypothetical protein